MSEKCTLILNMTFFFKSLTVLPIQRPRTLISPRKNFIPQLFRKDWTCLMVIVVTAQLEPGMVLSTDVRDINGRLLLTKGEKIQAHHIKILKKWGITEVNITGDRRPEDRPSPTVEPDQLEKAQAITRFVFSHIDRDHPAVKKLYDLCVDFRCHHNGRVTEIEINETKPGFFESEKILGDIYNSTVYSFIPSCRQKGGIFGAFSAL